MYRKQSIYTIKIPSFNYFSTTQTVQTLKNVGVFIYFPF